MATDASRYKAEAILRDGGSIHIRSLRTDDKRRLLNFFGCLSHRSVYFRFFRAKKWLSEWELERFTRLDFRDNVALVAIHREGE